MKTWKPRSSTPPLASYCIFYSWHSCCDCFPLLFPCFVPSLPLYTTWKPSLRGVRDDYILPQVAIDYGYTGLHVSCGGNYRTRFPASVWRTTIHPKVLTRLALASGGKRISQVKEFNHFADKTCHLALWQSSRKCTWNVTRYRSRIDTNILLYFSTDRRGLLFQGTISSARTNETGIRLRNAIPRKHLVM